MIKLKYLMEYSEGLIKRMIERWLSNIPNNQVDRNAFFREINAEDEEDAKIIMKSYIDEFDRIRNGNAIVEKDIEKYTSFLELKMEIDKHRPRKKHQNVTSELIDEGDLLYNENNLKILLGDDEEKCIKYGADAEGQFCISRKSGNLFNAYRIRKEYGHLVFYFVSDYDKPEDDEYSFAAIGVPEENSRMYQNGQYHLTNKHNTRSEFVYWNDIVRYIPKLKNLRHIFSPKALTKDEVRIRAEIKSWKYTEISYKYINSSYEHKQVYISLGKGLNKDMWTKTPTDLQNKYVNMGSDNVLQIIDLLNNSQKKSFVRQRVIEFTEINKQYNIPVSYDNSTNTIDFESKPQYPHLISNLLPYKLINVSERANNILSATDSSTSNNESDSEVNAKIRNILSNNTNLIVDYDNKTVKPIDNLDFNIIDIYNSYSYYRTLKLSDYNYISKNGWKIDENILYLIRWEDRADMVSEVDNNFPEKYLDRVYKIKYNSTKRMYTFQQNIINTKPFVIMDLENNSIDPRSYIYIKDNALTMLLKTQKIQARILVNTLNSYAHDDSYEIIFNKKGEIDIKFKNGTETYKKVPFKFESLLKNNYLLSPVLLAHAIHFNDGFNYPAPNLKIYKNASLIDAIQTYLKLDDLGSFENNILTIEKYGSVKFSILAYIISNLKNEKNIKMVLKNFNSETDYNAIEDIPESLSNKIDTTKLSNKELIKMFIEINSETAFYDKKTNTLSIFSGDAKHLNLLIKRGKILKEVDPESYAFFPKEYLYINSNLDIFARKKIFDKLNSYYINTGAVSLDGNVLTLKNVSYGYEIDFTPLLGYKHLKYKFDNVNTVWVEEELINKYNIVSNQVLEYLALKKTNATKINNEYVFYNFKELPDFNVCTGEYKYKLQRWPTDLINFVTIKPFVKLGSIDAKEYLKNLDLENEYLEYNSSDKIITIKQPLPDINLTDLIMYDDGNLMCGISDSSYDFLSIYDCSRLRNINFFKKSIIIKNFISTNKDAMTYEKIDDNKYLITDVDVKNFKISDVFEYGNNNYFSLSKEATKKMVDNYIYKYDMLLLNRLANSNLITKKSFLNSIWKLNSDTLEYDFDTHKFTIDTGDNNYNRRHIIDNLTYRDYIIIPIADHSSFDLYVSRNNPVPNGLPLIINGDIYLEYFKIDSNLNRLPNTMNNLTINCNGIMFDKTIEKTFNVKNNLILYDQFSTVNDWAVEAIASNLNFNFNLSGEFYLHDKIYEILQQHDYISKMFFEKIPYKPRILTADELGDTHGITVYQT